MLKFIKTLLGTTLLVCVLAFTGCGQVKEIAENLGKEKETSVETDEKVSKDEETTTNEKVEDEKVEDEKVDNKEKVEETDEKDFDLSKSEKAAYNFALAIQSEDYETAFSMLNISDTTFVSVDDLSWYIPRTDFDALVGVEDELTDVSSTGDNTYDTIQLSFGDNVVEVSVVLNNDNEWKIDLDGFCLTNWTFAAGKDIPITIGGVEITSDYIDKTEENKVYYTLPSIAARETTIVLSDDYFGTMELKVNPALEDEYYARFVLTEEQYAPIHEQLKVLLNDANALYETGATATDFAKFFYDENNADQIKLFYDEIEQSYTWNDSLDPTNIRYTIVQGRNEEDVINAYLATDEKIALNLAVEKTWDEKYGGNPNTRPIGYMFVSLTEDGTLKLNEVFVDNIISERNDFTNDW